MQCWQWDIFFNQWGTVKLLLVGQWTVDTSGVMVWKIKIGLLNFHEKNNCSNFATFQNPFSFFVLCNQNNLWMEEKVKGQSSIAGNLILKWKKEDVHFQY